MEEVHRIRRPTMPAYVIIIAVLSTLSFLYAFRALGQEVRLQSISQPFGGTQQRRMDQALRLSMSGLFTALALLSMMISGVLIWLSL
jgi:hypothetical protein